MTALHQAHLYQLQDKLDHQVKEAAEVAAEAAAKQIYLTEVEELYQLQDKLGHQVKEVEEVEVLGDMAEEQKEVPKK